MRPFGRGLAPPPEWASWTLLAAALVVGVRLRIRFAIGSPLWRDEAQLLGIAQFARPEEILTFLSHHESHPPLYFFLTRWWSALAGGSDLIAVGLPLLFGVSTIVAVFFAGRSLVSPGTGALGAWLTAVSPVLVVFSGSVRPYAFLGLLVLFNCLCLWRHLSKPVWRTRLAYLLSASLLVYTHNWTWLIITTNGVFWAGLLVLQHRRSTEWMDLLGTNILLVMLYLPWVPALINQIRFAGHVPWVGQTWASLFDDLAWGLTGLPGLAALCFVGLLALVGRRRGGDRKSIRVADPGPLSVLTWTVLGSTILATILQPWTPLLVWHSFSMLAPVTLLATTLVLRPQVSKARWVAAGTAVVLLVIYGLYSQSIGTMRKTNIATMTGLISRMEKAGDLVIVMPAYLSPSFTRYYGGEATTITYPDLEVGGAVVFDRRSARDRSPEALHRVLLRAQQTHEEGGRIWYLAYEGQPMAVREAGELIVEKLEELFGPPLCEATDPNVDLFFERTFLRLFANQAQTEPTLKGGVSRCGGDDE